MFKNKKRVPYISYASRVKYMSNFYKNKATQKQRSIIEAIFCISIIIGLPLISALISATIDYLIIKMS